MKWTAAQYLCTRLINRRALRRSIADRGWALVKVMHMRKKLTLVLCWLVMFGNAATVHQAASIAALEPEFRRTEIVISVVAILSLCCALILRAKIVKSLREDRAGGVNS